MRGGLVPRLRKGLDTFWLVPGLIALALALLAIALLVVDRRIDDDELWFGYQGGAGAARDVLAVLASSSITVAGLTFSIMIVTLQLVAGQYTPRALRTFLGDRITQVVAGTFVGVFAYSLLVLRSVRGNGDGGGDEVVPSLAISVGILLGLVALVLLIVFIHHMSQSIQIAQIAARIEKETRACLGTVYPARQGDAVGDHVDSVLESWHDGGDPAVIRLDRSGFVRAVDLGPLAAVASRESLRMHVRAVPGDFVTPSRALLAVWPCGAAEEDDLRDSLARSVVLANERDLREDMLFGLRQLADIAMRALSPGVNDPTTAATCLRHAQSILERLAATPLPDRLRVVDGTLLAVDRRSFGDALEPLAEVAAFAGGQPLVGGVVLDALGGIAWEARAAGYEDRVHEAVAMARRLFEPLFSGAATDADRRVLTKGIEAVERLAGSRRSGVGG